MKIAVVSDIHANFDAWLGFEEDYDELWILGDLVNYGPQPRETIEAARARADIIIQGNHDYAVAHDDDSRWSEKYRKLSTITRAFTSSAITAEQKRFLGRLPRQLQVERDGVIFHLTHATIADSHYGKWPRDDAAVLAQIAMLPARVIFCGHSHVPGIREVAGRIIVNPGSIGQSRSGHAVSSYAIWEDGKIELKSYAYPVESVIRKIRALDFPGETGNELARILTTATV